MRRKLIPALLTILILLSSCSQIRNSALSMRRDGEQSGSLGKTEDLKSAFSYVFGYMLANSATYYGDEVDYNYMAQGVLDFASGNSLFTETEMVDILTAYYHGDEEAAEAERQEQAARNVEEARTFLEANGRRSSVRTLDSGVQIEFLTRGEGASAENAGRVVVDYRLTLPDGSLADSSFERGTPTTFTLSNTLTGFAEAVRQMRVGDSVRVWIPPELGYGMNGPVRIPPMSYLIFDITLVDILDEG